MIHAGWAIHWPFHSIVCCTTIILEYISIKIQRQKAKGKKKEGKRKRIPIIYCLGSKVGKYDEGHYTEDTKCIYLKSTPCTHNSVRTTVWLTFRNVEYFRWNRYIAPIMLRRMYALPIFIYITISLHRFVVPRSPKWTV